MEPAVALCDEIRESNNPWTEESINTACDMSAHEAAERITSALKTLTELSVLKEKIGDLSEIECNSTSLSWLPILENYTQKFSEGRGLKTSATGELKIGFLANSLIKSAFEILNQVKIRGKSPSTLVEIEQVKTLVNLDHNMKKIISQLGLLEESIPNDRFNKLVCLSKLEKELNKVINLTESTNIIKEFLHKNLSPANAILRKNLNLNKLFEDAQAIKVTSEVNILNSELNSNIAKLKTGTLGHEYKFIEDYLTAVVGADVESINTSKAILETYIEQHDIIQEFISRLNQLLGSDFKLLETIVNWIDIEESREDEVLHLQKIRNLVEAFKWKRLGEFLGGNEYKDYSSYFRSITKFDEEIENSIRELARRRSWKNALERIEAETIVNMSRYAIESRKLGAGTGITADRRKREIRNYLNSCIPAIPAWIMPIDRVAQFFPAKLELFDVVIVDEASQARLDSIFLLALSKRVVIVGDHKQVSPDGGMLKAEDVDSIANRHLSDDSRKANWSNPELSLFDECKVSFGNMVTLTEHRRCVPEIIGFSNQIAYIPENIRLVPVRQTGSDALPPIKTIFVDDGYVQGSSGQLINLPEAERVAQEVLRMTKDSAYRGLTIGVVTLQGSKQQDVIRNRLINLISPSEFEKRQIRVGMPPDFQGSERNVILLSMVMAPNARSVAQTPETMVQRYNVAASRAKDQLVLVHSMQVADSNNPKDLRRQLLEYCINVERGSNNPVDGTIGLVPNDELVAPFDSLFEQRVHNRIVERGYKVIPQYKPEIDGHDYRIDLVVVGPYGKYAIECDGDFWHGGVETFEKDLIRQEILQRCGWKFFRIPESRFYGDPTCLDELWPQLEKFVVSKKDADDKKVVTIESKIKIDEEINEVSEIETDEFDDEDSLDELDIEIEASFPSREQDLSTSIILEAFDDNKIHSHSPQRKINDFHEWIDREGD